MFFHTLCNLHGGKSHVEAELDQAELPQVFADLCSQQVAPTVTHSKGDVDRNLLVHCGPDHTESNVQQLCWGKTTLNTSHCVWGGVSNTLHVSQLVPGAT